MFSMWYASYGKDNNLIMFIANSLYTNGDFELTSRRGLNHYKVS